MSIGYFIIGFLMICVSLFALVLTFRGYDWAIDKFEHFLFDNDLPDRLCKRILRK